MSKILVPRVTQSDFGLEIASLTEDEINDMHIEDVDFAENVSLHYAHPLANIGVTLHEAEARARESESLWFNQLPEKQTYVPTRNRKSKRW